MSKKLVGVISFWLMAAAVPTGVLFLVSEILGSFWFFFFLMLYVFLYRPFLNIHRLLSLKAIEEKEAWKFFVPFHHTRYMKTLWFG